MFPGSSAAAAAAVAATWFSVSDDITLFFSFLRRVQISLIANDLDWRLSVSVSATTELTILSFSALSPDSQQRLGWFFNIFTAINTMNHVHVLECINFRVEWLQEGPIGAN